MTSNNSGDISLPVFDGVEYKFWKIRLLKFLELKKCKDVVMRAKDSADDVTWDERNVQAMNYIYSAISNKQLEHVCELDTAYEIIKKFDDMHLKIEECHKKLGNIKLESYSEAHLFFDDFEKAVNELKQAGAEITEQEELNYMLKSLPQNNSRIGENLDYLPKDERSNYLKRQIKLILAREKSKLSDKRRITCYGCGNRGHVKQDCVETKNRKKIKLSTGDT